MAPSHDDEFSSDSSSFTTSVLMRMKSIRRSSINGGQRVASMINKAMQRSSTKIHSSKSIESVTETETVTDNESSSAYAAAGGADADAATEALFAEALAQEPEDLKYDESKPLQEELDDLTKKYLNSLQNDYTATERDQILAQEQAFSDEIFRRRVAENALQPGDICPNVHFTDQDGDVIDLYELLNSGKSVVLKFYRGSWCPYCHREIRRLRHKVHEIWNKGAVLLAVSPMKPDHTLVFADKSRLEFPVCSDAGNHVAKQFRLVVTIPENLRSLYRGYYESNLPEYNGDESWEMPLPATYIIDTDGRIAWSYVDNEPEKRIDPDVVIANIPNHSNNDKDGKNNNNNNNNAKESNKEICLHNKTNNNNHNTKNKIRSVGWIKRLRQKVIKKQLQKNK